MVIQLGKKNPKTFPYTTNKIVSFFRLAIGLYLA